AGRPPARRGERTHRVGRRALDENHPRRRHQGAVDPAAMDQNLNPDAVTLTKTLAAHLAAAQFGDLSPAAQHAARRGVLDWIGCALSACRHPAGDMLLALPPETGRPPP